MSVEKIFIYAAVIAGILLGIFLFPFVLGAFAPFIAAFAVAAAVQSFVRTLERKFHISRGVSSALISTAVVALGTGIVIFIAFQLYSQIKNLLYALPATLDSLNGQIKGWTSAIDVYKTRLPAEFSALFDRLVFEFRDSSQTISQRATDAAISVAGGLAAWVPKAFLFFITFILGTFFLTKDYVLVINFLKELLPAKAVKLLIKIKRFFSGAFALYLKAQLILMLLTSALVTVCLWVVGLEYPLLWGLISGLVDALPVLGTAIVLVPLALVALAYGDMYRFFGLIIVQILVFIFRQIAEPKVISRQIGVHPLLTLVGIYAGLRFFGIAGMLFAPLLILLAVNFYVSLKENG